MKKFIGLTLVVAMVSVVGLPLFAENGSPWDTTVPVSVGIAEMTELWMDNNAVALSITDAAGVNDDSRAVRSVTYLSNCPIDVSVQIAGDIIDGTYFYIVINPDVPAEWDYEGGANQVAEKHIVFLREGGAYSGNAPGDSIPAFSRGVTAPAATVPVVYGAQISPDGVVPAAGTESDFTVVWTIAPGSV